MHLHHRTVIIFSIFVVVALLGSFFIINYRQFTDGLISQYVNSITVCGNISEEETCVARESCEPIYGPAGPNDPRPEFRKCQRKSLATLVGEEREKAQCAKTGGEWYTNNFGSFCLCQKIGANMMFDRMQGCILKR